MAENEDDMVSVEAHTRVKTDNEKLKADLAAAIEKAKLAETGLTALQTEKAAADHFRAKNVANPYALASMAVDSAAVRGAENLPDALDQWYTSNESVFAPMAPMTDDEAIEPQPQPGFSGPNPGAPGDQARLTPVTRRAVLAKHDGVMTPAAAAELQEAMKDGRYQASYQPPPEFSVQ